MNNFLVLSFVVLMMAVVHAGRPLREEDFHVDAVIGNVYALQGLVGCFLDRTPCDPMSNAFKTDLPEGIQNLCGRCSPLQKRIFKKFLVGLKEKLPQDYEALKHTYDPKSKYFPTLEAALVNF